MGRGGEDGHRCPYRGLPPRTQGHGSSRSPEPAAPALAVTMETVPRHSCPGHTRLSEHRWSQHHEPRGREAEAGQLTSSRLAFPAVHALGAQDSPTVTPAPPAQVPAVFLAGSPSCLGAGFGGRRAERQAHPRLRFYGYEEEAEPQRVLKSHLELAQPDSTASASPLPSLPCRRKCQHGEKLPR